MFLTENSNNEKVHFKYQDDATVKKKGLEYWTSQALNTRSFVYGVEEGRGYIFSRWLQPQWKRNLTNAISISPYTLGDLFFSILIIHCIPLKLAASQSEKRRLSVPFETLLKFID